VSQPPPPAPPPPSGGEFAPTGAQSADLMTRFLARLIDGILLMIVNFIIVTTLIFGVLFSTGMGSRGGFMPFGGFSIAGLIASVVTAVIWVGYFAFMESSKGQTVGKMLLKLEVRGPDGQTPSLEVALKRNAWLALSIIPFIGGLAQLVVAIIIAVTINNSTTNTGWHDEFAGGTSVVKVG
jgi:uncharacterized RDD family membrane protein YckC